MNFLLDENFPKSAKGLIESLGHEVIDFREVGVEGAADAVVIATAELSSSH